MVIVLGARVTPYIRGEPALRGFDALVNIATAIGRRVHIELEAA